MKALYKEKYMEIFTIGGQRNYSLDLLRIVSMLMIVTLHIGSHGGMLEISSGITPYSIWFWLVEALCIVAVNVYILISGYFLLNERFRLSKMIKLIVETLFYSIIICVALIIKGDMSAVSTDTLASILPVSFQLYWFVSAYIGMYLLSPVLNLLIKKMTEKQHLGTIALMIIMMSIWSDVIPKASPFGDNRGYSVVWFIVLYIVAAYIRKYVNLSLIKHSTLMYFIISTVLVASWILLTTISANIPVLSEYLMGSYYFRYNSLLVFVSSVALFLTFAKLKINNILAQKLIKAVAPLTLGVYLIHDNPSMRTVIWKDIFDTVSFSVDLMLPIKAMGVTLTIFISCLMLDFIRTMLFKLLEDRKFMSFADSSVYVLYEKITKKVGDKL